MYCIDYRAARAVLDACVKTAQRQSTALSLEDRPGNDQSGGLSWQGRQLLYRLGQQLVILGRRLERYGLPQPSL
jgi:hypothetical protein